VGVAKGSVGLPRGRVPAAACRGSDAGTGWPCSVGSGRGFERRRARRSGRPIRLDETWPPAYACRRMCPTRV